MMRFLVGLFGIILLFLTLGLTAARAGTNHLLWLEFTALPRNSGWVYCRLYFPDHAMHCGDKAASSQARVWSPDGRWAAFAAFDDQTGQWTLFRRQANSQRAENLLDGASFTYVDTPTWSPDGKWLLFAAQVNGNDFDLYRIRYDGGDFENLTGDIPGDQWLPTWSPNGDWIAFTVWEISKPATLYVMHPDGSQLHLLVEGLQNAFRPVWSPDGAWLLFESGCEDLQTFLLTYAGGFCNPVNFDVYRVRPDGSQLTRLTTSSDDDYAAAWSPDGEWISYVSRPLGELRQLSDIYGMRSESGEVRRLTDESGAYVYPIWSPIIKFTWRWGLLVGLGVLAAGYRVFGHALGFI